CQCPIEKRPGSANEHAGSVRQGSLAEGKDLRSSCLAGPRPANEPAEAFAQGEVSPTKSERATFSLLKRGAEQIRRRRQSCQIARRASVRTTDPNYRRISIVRAPRSTVSPGLTCNCPNLGLPAK